MLDGQVADAPPGIEPVRRRECVGRADVEATPAAAAMVSLRLVRRQGEVGQDLAQEQPGAQLARDEVGVLALPTQARLLRQRLLQDRGGVHEHLDLAGEPDGDPASQLLQAALEHIVVVAVARIDRDITPILRVESRQRVERRTIVQPTHDRGPRLRPHPFGRLPPLGLARQPAHGAVIARGQGRSEALTRDNGQHRRGYSQLVQPVDACAPADGVGDPARLANGAHRRTSTARGNQLLRRPTAVGSRP